MARARTAIVFIGWTSQGISTPWTYARREAVCYPLSEAIIRNAKSALRSRVEADALLSGDHVVEVVGSKVTQAASVVRMPVGSQRTP